jgi:hypothetical protein
MKNASLPAPPTAATKNDRRISFIRNATAATHTWATPQKRLCYQEVQSS